MAAAEEEMMMVSHLTDDVSLPGVNESDLERELQHFDDEEVTVDFNHPLSGRNILFDVIIHRVVPEEIH